MGSDPHGIDLRQDIDAIAILTHHPQQSTDLTFDSPQPHDDCGFRLVFISGP
jgi:hypothetical protein